MYILLMKIGILFIKHCILLLRAKKELPRGVKIGDEYLEMAGENGNQSSSQYKQRRARGGSDKK